MAIASLPHRLVSHRTLRHSAAMLLLTVLTFASTALAASTQVVAVYSKNLNGYTRTLTDDNRFAPETYTFAEGGRLDGYVVDESIDHLPFMKIAQVLSLALRSQNYLPAVNASQARLLVAVSWGTTTGWDSNRDGGLNQLATAINENAIAVSQLPASYAQGMSSLDTYLTLNQMSNEVRDRNNCRNAAILGYSRELRDAEFLKPYAPTLATDVISDVEEDRYFVVLKAYDFQLAWKEKKWKQLWETRFSVRQFGNRFDQTLPSMAQYASRYFGQDLGRLVRRPIPGVKVDVGTPTVVEPLRP